MKFFGLLVFLGGGWCGLGSTDLFAQTTYDLYFNRFFESHVRGGLAADREICQDSPCRDRFDGYRFQSSLKQGWYLAWLAKDYQNNLHDRALTLQKLNEALDALNRLGKYTSKESATLLNEIRRLGLPTVREEFDIRKGVFENLPSSGYLLRSDLDRGFDLFVEDRILNHELEPDLDFYVSVLFGLVSVKKFVGDPALNRKASDIALRIYNTLQRMDLQLVRPWDLKPVQGRYRLRSFVYPLFTSLRYLVDEAAFKPNLSKKWIYRLKWRIIEREKIENARWRCDQNLWISMPFSKCRYDQIVTLFMMSALVSFEDNVQFAKGNRNRFEWLYTQGFLAFDRNPILAAIAKGFYGVNNQNVQTAFAGLDDVPNTGLPNSAERKWKDFFSLGAPYLQTRGLEKLLEKRAASLERLPVSTSAQLSTDSTDLLELLRHVPVKLEGEEPGVFAEPAVDEVSVLEYSGLDYLMPQAFRLEN